MNWGTCVRWSGNITFIAAILFFAAIGCDGESLSYTGFGDGDMYHVTKQACSDAIKEQLPTESLKKFVITYDAQGAPKQVEAPIEATMMPYDVLYKMDGDKLVVNDAPEGVLHAVVVLVDESGKLYFFDEPTDPIFGHKFGRDKKFRDGTETSARLYLAINEWSEKVNDGVSIVVVPPEVDETNQVNGIHTFKVAHFQ